MLIKLKKKFYFEAIMIEYNIIEDRVSSILFHSNFDKDVYDKKTMLGKKINSIKNKIEKADNIISKNVTIDLINETKNWKDDRNDLVHKACTSYDAKKMKNCAQVGKKIGRELDKCANKIKKEMNKKINISK